MQEEFNNNKRQERIGIYGGTFDPIHIGHLAIAQRAMEEFDLDRVYFLIAYTPPHKNDRSNGAEDRLSMLRLAIENNEKFLVDDREIRAAEVRYSVDSLEEIKKERSDSKIFFIMGGDSLLTFRSWYHWEDILKKVDLIVHPREDKVEDLEQEADYLRGRGYKINICRAESIPVSSGQIRRLGQEGRSIRYLVPEKVYKYIMDRGLYGGEERGDQAFLSRVQDVNLDFMEEDYYQEIIKVLKKDLNPHRYRHCIGVVRTALMLADLYKVDPTDAAKAALLHDCAKHNEEKYIKKLSDMAVISRKKFKAGPTLHARVGALAAKYFFNIDDESILSAIKNHTTGKKNMTKLEKIIFLADGIEPSRSYPGLVEIRLASLEDLNKAILLYMDRTIGYLLENNSKIDIRTIKARNYILTERSKN